MDGDNAFSGRIFEDLSVKNLALGGRKVANSGAHGHVHAVCHNALGCEAGINRKVFEQGATDKAGV